MSELSQREAEMDTDSPPTLSFQHFHPAPGPCAWLGCLPTAPLPSPGWGTLLPQPEIFIGFLPAKQRFLFFLRIYLFIFRKR